MSKTLTYTADGLTMHSQFFSAGPATAPGVLVFPEAFGLSDHALHKAERLADMGYHALACDLHGDAKLVSGLDEAIGLLQPLFTAPGRTRARASAALSTMLDAPLPQNPPPTVEASSALYARLNRAASRR